MKKLSGFLLLLIPSLFLSAQGNENIIVSEWRFDESTEQIYIEYDLEKRGNSTYYDVELVVNFFGIDLQIVSTAVSGDIGPKVRWGKNKRIVLDVFEVAARVDPNGRILVRAIPVAVEQLVPEDICPKTDYYIGGGGLAVGAGLLTFGVVNLFHSDISTYREECDPDAETAVEGKFIIDPVTEQSICDEDYKEANKRYKQGQIFTGLGLLAAGVGTYFLIKKPFIIKCESNKTDYREGQPDFFSISPDAGFRNFDQEGNPEWNMGLRVRYTF